MFIIVLRNFVCLIGLIAIAPFLVISSLLIVLEDGFPVFFIQSRIGLNQERFRIIKLRTLKRESPQIGTHELDEEYKLKVGKLIRSFKIDEFPQLYNVLKGELNLVGPRPGLESQKALEEARLVLGVHHIKPGITGLSQVLGYDMSNVEKLAEVDKIYIENRTFKINTLILFATFFKFIQKYLSIKFNIPNLKN